MLRYLQLTFALLLVFAQHYALAAVPGLYAYEKENVWLPMADGVRLSVTLTSPTATNPNEKFPVLLEYKPYRKDDNSFNAEQVTVIYLVRRGFIVSANAGSYYVESIGILLLRSPRWIFVVQAPLKVFSSIVNIPTKNWTIASR